MAEEILNYEVTVLGGAIDTLIGELIVADSEEVKVLEVGFEITGLGTIAGFIRQRQIDDINDFVFPDENNRVVKSIPLQGGDRYSFFGTDLSGAPNRMGVCLVIDRKIKGF